MQITANFALLSLIVPGAVVADRGIPPLFRLSHLDAVILLGIVMKITNAQKVLFVQIVIKHN
jgi:hypothetical protein